MGMASILMLATRTGMDEAFDMGSLSSVLETVI